MASIKKYQGKGGISWNVRVRKGGKLHSGTFPTKRMAEEFAIKLEHQIVQEHYDLVPHKPIIHTCRELIQLYLERKMPEKDPGTQRRQRQILRWWDSVLQDTPVKNVTPVLIEEYKHVLLNKKGFTPGTVNLYLNTLSPVFTWAASPSLNWLQLNPFVHVPRLKDQPRLPIVSDEQLNMLIYWCDQSQSTPLPIFIRIALGTGGRHREILRLRWSHINLKQRTIRYTNTKNKDDRIVPLPSALVDYLTPLYEELFGGDKWMFNLPDGTWVFPNTRTKKGQHMVTMYGPWAKAREKAGLGWMHIHDLRHLYASLAAEKGGADLGMLSDLLGHRQIKSTMRYRHITPKYAASVVEKMGKEVFK